MELRDAIDARRARRSLAPEPVPDELVHDVMERVRLAPSCFKPPALAVRVRPFGRAARGREGGAEQGNAWATGPRRMIVAGPQPARPRLRHRITGPAPREYYRFDTGMATAYLQLLLTEAGLVAHPIAGYSESAAAAAVGAPEGMAVVTLVIVGRLADEPSPLLSEKQRAVELARPTRKPVDEVAFFDRYPA